MQPLLLLLAFLLPPGAKAGEIIGGQETRPHSRPYMAFLQIQSPEGGKNCGGFLVREDFVLTAAHCWGSSINVILGAHNVRRRERTQQRVPVRRAIRHPQYDPQNFRNDIMLLQLSRRIRRNRNVSPVALPRTPERLRPRTLCTVAGWGLVSLTKRTDRLREVQLRVQRDEQCFRTYRAYDSRTQLCVGDPRERKTAFRGDSGGPLVCRNAAHGIVSYGSQTATPPAVFTRVTSFLSWIRRTMRRLEQLDQMDTAL
ncbi:cathepsin G [Callithrix jacchus]|uniref:Cathepsin G n=1 Tax=Callithrix jacchus TaxID=9483 RepID=F7HD23_CALJA|nr:cathepsin G [Callithrix jacchus]